MSGWTPTTEQVRSGYATDPEDEYRNPINAASNKRENERAFDRWLAEVKAEALREHRQEWAGWIEDHGAYVGTKELTQGEIVGALRWEHPPFGWSANPTP